MAGEHGAYPGSVALGQPEAPGVFIDDEDIAITIGAAEEDDGKMGEAVVEGTEPFTGAGIVETGEGVRS